MSSDNSDLKGYIVDVLAAFVLGLGTIAGAFAAYQSTLWDGLCAQKYNQAAIASSHASGQFLFGVQAIMLDGILFMEEKTQRSLGTALAQPSRVELANYWRDRVMSPELKTAMAWAEQHDTIFSENDTYLNGRIEGAVALSTEAENAIADGQRADDNGDGFTLCTVFFTVVLFFAGMASVMRRFPLKVFFLGMGSAMLGLSLVRLILLPFA